MGTANQKSLRDGVVAGAPTSASVLILVHFGMPLELAAGFDLSVRSASVEMPKACTNGTVQLWADFSAELPMPNDIVSMNLDGAQLFSEPFSAFFRLGHGQTYILLKKGVLAWFDFKEGELSVVTPKADLALFDPSNGVDVALRIGGASGTENIKMVQQGSRRFVYMRP
jgi:hypothetical protein